METDAKTESDRFLKRLFSLHAHRGSPLKKVPVVGHRDLELYRLFMIVEGRGGFRNVQEKKMFREIGKELQLPETVTNVGYLLRSKYEQILLPFTSELRDEFYTGREDQRARDRARARRDVLDYHVDRARAVLPFFDLNNTGPRVGVVSEPVPSFDATLAGPQSYGGIPSFNSGGACERERARDRQVASHQFQLNVDRDRERATHNIVRERERDASEFACSLSVPSVQRSGVADPLLIYCQTCGEVGPAQEYRNHLMLCDPELHIALFHHAGSAPSETPVTQDIDMRGGVTATPRGSMMRLLPAPPSMQ
ncbi:hypothetical protein KIPB_008629, partial [Kipferlia bialata]|eukprot:g8629.t1